MRPIAFAPSFKVSDAANVPVSSIVASAMTAALSTISTLRPGASAKDGTRPESWSAVSRVKSGRPFTTGSAPPTLLPPLLGSSI